MKLSRHVTRWIHYCSNCTKGRRSVDPRLLCMVCILHSVLELRSSHNWCVRIIYCACWCIYTHCSESHEMPICITHSFRVDRWSGLYCIVSFICNVSVTGQRSIVSCNGWGTGYVVRCASLVVFDYSKQLLPGTDRCQGALWIVYMDRLRNWIALRSLDSRTPRTGNIYLIFCPSVSNRVDAWSQSSIEFNCRQYGCATSPFCMASSCFDLHRTTCNVTLVCVSKTKHLHMSHAQC